MTLELLCGFATPRLDILSRPQPRSIFFIEAVALITRPKGVGKSHEEKPVDLCSNRLICFSDFSDNRLSIRASRMERL